MKIECTGCKKSLQVAAGLAGKKFRCPGCKLVVAAPKPAATKPAPTEIDDVEELDEEVEDENGEEGVAVLPFWAWVVSAVAGVILLFTFVVAMLAFGNARMLHHEVVGVKATALEATETSARERDRLQETIRKLEARLAATATSTQPIAGQPVMKERIAKDEPTPPPTVAQGPSNKERIAEPKSGVQINEKPPATAKEPSPSEKPRKATSVSDGGAKSMPTDTWEGTFRAGGGSHKIRLTVTKDRKSIRSGSILSEIVRGGSFTISNTPVVGDPIPVVNDKFKSMFAVPGFHFAGEFTSVTEAKGTAALNIQVGASQFGPQFEMFKGEWTANLKGAAPKPATASKTTSGSGDAPKGLRITEAVRARAVDTGDDKTLTANFPDKDVPVMIKLEGARAGLGSGADLFRKSFVLAGGVQHTFNTLTVPASGGNLWAGVVLPKSDLEISVNIFGYDPVTTTLPVEIVERAKIGR